MSKLFKRLLCLLLGIVMGISATVGSIATSVYYLYGNLTIADVLPDDKDRLKDALGDLGDYSAEDVIALFSKALKAPQNYTIEDLEREYGFNLVDLINQAAGSDVIDTKNPDNKPYVDDLKSVSLFALLSGQVNVTEFLSDIPLGAVMSFVPSDTILDNEQREKLRKYSIGSLAAKDETTGTPVAVSALSELTIGGILPGIFEKSGDKYIVKDGKPDALGLIANLKLGGFVSPLTGATTIGDELVSGGLSALGELSLGEIYRTVGVNDENDVAGTLDGLFTDSEGNPIKLRDLFAKDISSGNDSYVFVVDKLLDSIRFGTLFGMTRKDGEWVVRKDDGTEEKATGLLKFLANLNLTDVYHALTDAATTKDRIHKIILIFGDLSVGDVFETLGYSKDEDGRWVKPDGSRLKSRVAEALLDFSIRDIVGEASSELSFDQIRKNIVGAISGLCDDMTIGEGFGELFGVAAANGKYYDPETGNPVNEAIARILDIKIRDITDCFAKDKINVDEIYGVFEKAIAGVYVGAILGAERIDGEWYANGGKVTDALAMLYNVRLEGLFSVIKELQNPDGFSYSEIIKGFLPEACVGDILCAVSGMTRHNVGDSAYFTDANGSPVGEGLNKLLRLRLWQIAAGFDKNGNFDLKAVLDEIKVGDALGAVYDADKNEWTLLDRTAKGGLAEIMNVSLGLLVSGDTEKINDTLTGDAKNVSLGDVLTFALAYKDGKILNSDAELNEFAQKFIEWNAPTVNYVEDLVKNKDFEKLRNDINAQFGALKIGEAFRPYLVSRNDEGKYVFSALEQISGIVEPIFNTDFKVVVDIIFDLIAGKSVDFGKILTDIYGSLTIGEVIAPIVGLSLTDGTAQVEAGKKVYVTNNGNGTSLGLGVTALMKTSIFGLVQSVIDGVNNKDGKNLVHRLFGTTEEEGAIDIDHVLGEYVYSFLKLDYDGKDWTNGDGKTYAPITTLLNANLYEIIDHVLDINKAYTADEKKDYFIGILDDLTIKDILSFSKGITESDKALVQKVGDVKLVRFVVDLIEKNDRIAVIKESGFGKVAIGDLVQLAVDIKQDATGWKKSGGEYFACMISDAFSLDVNKIFEITDDIKAGGDNVVTEVFNKVFPERRVGDFVNVLIPSLSDDCTRGNYKTWGTNKAAGDLPLVLSDVFNLKFKTFFDALLGEKKSAVDIVLTITDEIFGDPVNNHPEHASWARSFNDYMKDFGLTYLDEHKAFDDIKDVKVGEFIYHVLKDKDPAAYLEGLVNNISLGDIAELPLGEEGVQKLPLVARDLCDVLVGDIIQIVKGGEKLKANICATIDKVTKNDAEGHRFGDYLDDLLKGKASESIIKTNEGLKGITDIKISELVKVILKQTTVEMKTDGTLAKMGVSDKLPEGLKNIIIYICDNITDNALIGDFLINGANGYRKEANGDGYIWYDSNGKACEDILNTVYSLETSYVLYLIGGIYIVATEPDTVMQEVLKLKAGTIVMPIYNLMLEKAGEYASKMTCSDTKEESEKVYEIKGLYKDLLTKLSNMTLGEIKDEVQTRPMWIAEYFYNRELGDLLYDALSMTVGKTLGIEGFAYEHKGPDGYTTDNKVLTAVFNFNVKSMLDATDKAEYILKIFGEVRVGDLVNLVSNKITYDENIGLWVNGTQTAKYIVNDLFNITANNVTEWVKAIKAGIVEDVIRLIVADVTVNRTLDDYLSDIGNATVDRIIANGAFDKIAREETLIQVTDVVLNNLKNKKYVDLITYYFGDIRVGDVANIVNGNIKYDANIGLWVNGTQTAKYIVSDLFDIGVNAVKEVVDVAQNGGSAEKVVKKAAEKLFKTRTLEDYLLDIGNANVTKVVEKAIFDQLMRKESVVQIINYVLDRIYYKDYAGIAEHYLGEAKLGAVAEFVNGIEAPAAEGAKWTYKNGGIPYVLGDAMDLTFADVIGMFAAKSGETLPTWQNRIATLVAKYTKNDLRTLKTYIEDLAGKSLNVKGLADLSDIRIAELVSVALKVNAEEIKADEGGTLDKLGATNDLSASVKNLVIYVCNITDKVLLGDYLTQLDNPEGGVHRDADGKWFNKTTEVTGLLKTIYGLPTTYLFGAVVAVVKPQLVIDAVGGYKIGKLIKKPYNNALRSLESSIGETNGEYYAEGSFKAVVDTFVNLTVNDILADIKAGTFVDGLEAKFILDRKLGDYLFDLISILAKKTNKSGYGIKGYAYESVNAEGLYETRGNFKKIYDIVLNIKFKEDLFDQKSNVLVHLKEMFQTLYLGDLFYDVLRSVSKSKLCEGYGYENFEENIGYKLDKQFADVLGAVFNVQLLDINNCIGKDFTARFKTLLKVKFGELTVGDFGYDLFAKYLATKLSLKANGYAYEFKADNTMLKGKAAKVVAATFNISLNDIDALMKNYSAASGKAKNTAIINFVIDTYGTLTVGDVLGAIVEKLTATKLQMTYTYDEDYNLTVTGNFKEIANIIFSSSSGDLLRAIRANNVKAYFLGDQKGTTDGLVGGLNLGDVLGYALKAKTFKGFVKNTDIERNETTGKWEIARSFSHPLSILCNDVTISGLLRKINDPKQFIINTLGDVCVGEMLGKYLVDDVWYKADGTVEDVSAENGGVIMKHVYGIKLGELLGEGFNINKILGDVYVGELIGYAHCGKKYTKTEGEHTQYNVCTEETHTDNADGYHIHADECNVTGHTETTHKTGWYKKDGETYVEIDAVASVMADLRLGYVLGNPNMKLADLFGDLKLGDVLGYAYCDNAGTGKCTVTGHTAHDGKFTWYVKNGGTYSVAGALETALADVKMKDILSGNFDINEVIGDIYIGELMGYTYCDHAAGGTCTVTGHTETTHDAELTWYKKNGETPAALENALAGVQLKEILDGNFDINGVIADIYVGELIGYDYCGKKYTKTEGEHTQYNVCTEETHTDNADGYHIHADECTLGHSETSHEAGWYKKNAAGVPEKVGVVEGVMADIRLGYILGNGDVKFGDMFGSLKLGDVLGYDYCDMAGAGATNKCTVEGHTSATHDKVKTLTWYVKESAGYRMANAIERTLANVPMKDILNGTFNVDDTLNKLKLGNLMKYEYCTGDDTTCMIDHSDHTTVGWYKEAAEGWEYIGQEAYCDGNGKFCDVGTHDHNNPPTTGYTAGWYHYDAKSGKWVINEDGKNTGNNIVLCMIGRSVNDFRGSNFTTELVNDINNYVLIGDIYDMTEVTGPIKLISPNTKIGDISSTMANVMKKATAKELNENGLLPVSVTTTDRMSEVYGAVIFVSANLNPDGTYTWKDPETYSDAIVPKSGTTEQADKAIEVNDAYKPTATPGTAEYDEQLKAYEKAIGKTYWESLTIDQLVDVLLLSARV